MNDLKTLAAAGALLLAFGFAAPCHADSVASSASSGASTSVGSLSDSIKGSSNSSKKTVAEGDYRIIEVAAADDRPGSAALTLRPMAQASDAAAGDADLADAPRNAAPNAAPDAERDLIVYLPQPLVERQRLAVGQTVAVHGRPYGVAFMQREHAFFLALDDAWLRELQSHALPL